MGFFPSKTPHAVEDPDAQTQPGLEGKLRIPVEEPPPARAEDIYAELVSRRPNLVEVKLKLHERIIDEFNLAALDKLPPDELSRQVRTYVGNYARSESLSLNQKELDLFSNEVIDELTGYGPIEPLL
jgi:pilus assembly protein CpaF